MVEVFQSMGLRLLSFVVTVRISTGSVEGGANRPDNPKMTVDPAGTVVVKAFAMVTV